MYECSIRLFPFGTINKSLLFSRMFHDLFGLSIIRGIHDTPIRNYVYLSSCCKQLKELLIFCELIK